MKQVKVFVDYLECRGKAKVFFKAEYNGKVKEVVVDSIYYPSSCMWDMRVEAMVNTLKENLFLEKEGFEFVVYANGIDQEHLDSIESVGLLTLFDFGEEFSSSFKEVEFKEFEDWTMECLQSMK